MKLKIGLRTITPYLIVVFLVGLQACGGGGSAPTPAPVVTPAVTPIVNTSLASAARGYYEGFATIDVAAGDLMITNPNFKAIVDEKQFVMAFKGIPLLLYKGTFTEVTDTTFKADIRAYKGGAFFSTASISNGTITAGTSLKGTISGGTGDYVNSVGDVELTYNAANALAPKTYKPGAGNPWQDAGPTTGNVKFNTSDNIDFTSSSNAPSLTGCDAVGFDTANVVYAQTGRIRTFTTTGLTGCGSPVIQGTTLNGYFTNYNGNGVDDDRMLFVASNDDVSYIGILPCGPTPNDPSTCFTP